MCQPTPPAAHPCRQKSVDGTLARNFKLSTPSLVFCFFPFPLFSVARRLSCSGPAERHRSLGEEEPRKRAGPEKIRTMGGAEDKIRHKRTKSQKRKDADSHKMGQLTGNSPNLRVGVGGEPEAKTVWRARPCVASIYRPAWRPGCPMGTARHRTGLFIGFSDA